jgi:hypothetical protein
MTSFTRATAIHTVDALFNSVWATTKSGKTTYAIGREGVLGHWPLPIFFMNFDHRVHELLPFCEERVREALHIADLVPPSPFMNDAQAKAMLDQTENATREALAVLKSEGTGTFVIDTATALNQLIQRVDLAPIQRQRQAKDQPLYPYDYGDANARFRNYILQIKSVGCNAVMLHHAQQVYDGKGQPTNFFRPQDNSQMDKLTQIQMMLYKQVEQVGEAKIQTFNAKVELCGLNPSLEGMSLPTNLLDYPGLYQLIYGRPSPYV